MGMDSHIHFFGLNRATREWEDLSTGSESAEWWNEHQFRNFVGLHQWMQTKAGRRLHNEDMELSEKLLRVLQADLRTIQEIRAACPDLDSIWEHFAEPNALRQFFNDEKTHEPTLTKDAMQCDEVVGAIEKLQKLMPLPFVIDCGPRRYDEKFFDDCQRLYDQLPAMIGSDWVKLKKGDPELTKEDKQRVAKAKVRQRVQIRKCKKWQEAQWDVLRKKWQEEHPDTPLENDGPVMSFYWPQVNEMYRTSHQMFGSPEDIDVFSEAGICHKKYKRYAWCYHVCY